MHPPIHSIMRYVRTDIPVPGTLNTGGHNYVVPQGQYLLASPGYSQMDSAHWDHPETFDPYRWFSKKEDDFESDKQDFGFGTISTGASSPYLPFGAGRYVFASGFFLFWPDLTNTCRFFLLPTDIVALASNSLHFR